MLAPYASLADRRLLAGGAGWLAPPPTLALGSNNRVALRADQ